MPHLFWAVDCKGENCNTQIFLKYIGVYEPNKIPFLVDMNPNPIVVQCDDCSGSYEYHDYEVVSRISDDPPPAGYVDRF